MKNFFKRLLIAIGAVAAVGAPLAARADTSDPTTGLMTSATTYFGYVQTNITTILTLVIAIAVVVGIGSMIIGYLRRKH